MFRNIATTKRIDLSYEIMVLRSVKSIKNVSSVVAAVSAESYTSDSNVKTERVQKEIYRSLLADTAALNTMRQIEATQYTTVKDFK